LEFVFLAFSLTAPFCETRTFWAGDDVKGDVAAEEEVVVEEEEEEEEEAADGEAEGVVDAEPGMEAEGKAEGADVVVAVDVEGDPDEVLEPEPESSVLVYTTRLLTSQYASANAAGFVATKSSHVAAPVLAAQEAKEVEAPAQEPQKVVSKMRLCVIKCESQSQEEPDHCAFGVPQEAGEGLAESTSAGAAPRVQCQMEIPVEVHSVA
jgi:hypothetical protein